jgi:predicted nucleic acid-binding protein
MRYLLDTNVVSETKRKIPNQGVIDFITKVNIDDIYFSCLTIGELKAGALKKARTDPVAAKSIMKWIEDILFTSSDRIISVNLEACQKWAEFLAIDRTNAIDSLLAAQAATNDMILVTRNIKHVQIFGVNCLNPFVE